MTLRELGRRIQYLREQRGKTIEKLAWACEISKGGLSLIERGLRDPRFSTLNKLAKALRVPLNSLFGQKSG